MGKFRRLLINIYEDSSAGGAASDLGTLPNAGVKSSPNKKSANSHNKRKPKRTTKRREYDFLTKKWINPKKKK